MADQNRSERPLTERKPKGSQVTQNGKVIPQRPPTPKNTVKPNPSPKKK